MKKIIFSSLIVLFITTLITTSLKTKNDSKNIYSFNVENQKVNEIPSNEYVFNRGECNNGATLKWDRDLKQATITGSVTNKTKCDLYFSKNPSKEYLENLQKTKPSELAYDKTNDNNIRFIGSNPNNYVSFNNDEYIWRGYYVTDSCRDNYYSCNYEDYNSYEECTSMGYSCEKLPAWRIIGVMNNIEEENGVVGSHLKIIRYSTSMGQYSWDSSPEYVNNGWGINEWSTSDIEEILNNRYYKKKAGGTCFNNLENYTATCPKWENIGLDEEAKTMISKVKWNTGASLESATRTPSYMYEMERSENHGKMCGSGSYCNDKVTRTTSWTGYVGLMYPSDFGFATSGGSEEQRENCLTISMYNWGGTNQVNCSQNSWLRSIYNTWTMTPANSSTICSYVHYVPPIKSIDYSGYSGYILPVVYLNTNIKIEEDNSENYGSKDNPFRLIN